MERSIYGGAVDGRLDARQLADGRPVDGHPVDGQLGDGQLVDGRPADKGPADEQLVGAAPVG